MAFFLSKTGVAIAIGSAIVAPTREATMLCGGAKQPSTSKHRCELDCARPHQLHVRCSLSFVSIDRRSTHSDGTFNFLNPSVALVSCGLSSNAFLKFLRAQSLSPADTQASPRLS